MSSRRTLVPALLGVMLTLSLAISLVMRAPYITTLIDRIELIIYDLRLKAMLAPYHPESPVVIIDISEESLAAVGQWPWPRDQVAKLVDRAFELGAGAVAFDVVFAEAERNSALQVINKLDASEPDDQFTQRLLSGKLQQFDNNRVLAESLDQGEVVLGYAFNNDEKTHAGTLPAPIATDLPVERMNYLMSPRGYSANIALLQETAASGGFFSLDLTPDIDGVIRRAPIVSNFGNHLYASLALESVRRFMFDAYKIYTSEIGDSLVINGVEVGGVRIPTDKEGNMIIPYHGRAKTFPYISAHHLLDDGYTTEELEGSVAIIGASAQGLLDLRHSPLEVSMPGVEIHANMVSGILNDNLYVEPPWADSANITALLVVGMLLAIALPFLGAGVQIAFATLVLLSLVGANFWLWSEKHFVLNLAPQLLVTLMLSMFNGFNGHLWSVQREKIIKGMFGRYIPPQLVHQMSAQSDDNYSIEGQTKELSVLFADIRGFTTISERLTAHDLRNFLNQFFTPMTRIIFNNQGTIDKYVGDMIMAFWGAPIDDPHHARNAVLAAQQMIAKAREMADANEKAGLPRFDIGAGINTGSMSVGDMGSEFRRAYTVLGDSVNLASRLEGLTKFYGVDIIVGDLTAEQTRDTFVYRSLDIMKAKGKENAIEIFAPECQLSELNEQIEQELNTYNQALEIYRQGNWSVARVYFWGLAQEHPGRKIYMLYFDRCTELLLTNPADWTPEYVHTSK